MSAPSLVIINSLEEATSSDVVRVGQLAGKAVMDSLFALTGGIENIVIPPPVVRRGLNASVGGGLSTNIDTGELMQFVSGVVANQSVYKLGANLATANLVHAAADPVNPRIDRISVAINTVDTDSTNRSELVLPNRTIMNVLVNKTRNPNLVFTVTTGVPGVSPSPPVTPVGQTAIWDVLILANAVATNSNFYMDLRVRFHPWVLLRRHGAEQGLLVGTADSVATSIRVVAGFGFANGGAISIPQHFEVPFSTAQEPGGPALAADQLWHCYLIPVGCGSPVGSTLSNGLIVILSQTAPGVDGRPSAPINYNPLIGAPGAPALVQTSSNALYIGTVPTTAGATFEHGGAGVLLDHDGESIDPRDPVTGGIGVGTINIVAGDAAMGSASLIKKPHLQFSGASTITVGQCVALINGRILQSVSGDQATFASHYPVAIEGARTASTWYYLYIRPRTSSLSVTNGRFLGRNARKTPTYRISAFPPNDFGNPDPASAFVADTVGGVQLAPTEYVFIGSFYNNTGNVIEPFYREGNAVLFTNTIGFLNTVLLPTGVTETIAAGIPLPITSAMGIFELYASYIANGAGNTAFTLAVFAQTGNTNPMFSLQLDQQAQGAGPIKEILGQHTIPVTRGPSQFQAQGSGFINLNGNPALEAVLLGYVEDVGGFSSNYN